MRSGRPGGDRERRRVNNDSGEVRAGIDRTKVRLSVLGIVILVAFGALFSRLWFLQVLASEQYSRDARENRVRKVRSEPPRGRILDINGKPLVTNRWSLSVTIDRQVVAGPRRQRRIIEKLAVLLDEPRSELRERLADTAVSPYKPVPVANDVSRLDVTYIQENPEDFRGVDFDLLPIRKYPNGNTAAHLLGYVGSISEGLLEEPYFKDASPRYRPGDIVGQAGVERTYDRWLRGTPEVKKVIVNSTGEVIHQEVIREETPGNDLVLALDLSLQKLTEDALLDGILAARGEYQAPAGAVTVMDPDTGRVVAMASYPTYPPAMLADGITFKEWDSLGFPTKDNPDDDRILNRAIAGQRPPGSTYKVVTAGAAMASGVASTSTYLSCPGSYQYRDVTLNNWTSADSGVMGFAQSLEQSCDTFYYELGARMEDTFGAQEVFQKYARKAGFDNPTGIDVLGEASGRVPDRDWCDEINDTTDICKYGWLPGYTVNMSIGQGDLIVTPLQMATTYAAIANGGRVWEPQVASHMQNTDTEGKDRTIRTFRNEVANRLPLDAAEIGVLQTGLRAVISGAQGTAASAFAGFPLGRAPLAGKTGTAQLASGETELNDAWFVSYGPSSYDPDYVISVYVEKAGHGGESAAPIARQIWEGIAGVDKKTDEVTLATDSSG